MRPCLVTILFEKWKVSTVGELIGSMVAIFILAALYEGLKFFRDFLLRRAAVTSRSTLYSSKSPTPVPANDVADTPSRPLYQETLYTFSESNAVTQRGRAASLREADPEFMNNRFMSLCFKLF
ncbi:unnamed protein product [Cyprideis torosa]|uniref:Copper transport protein n=1 Tax=Cyprideis torosa TaxID=163714 RepID=A0A7R8W9T1_9CRUS|nr:unnamed protein product [Cyprideis torosa]CAG0885181.1 unnamed protein product [Cyprideis torosa]